MGIGLGYELVDIAVGKGPTGIAITPDGAFVYVANFFDGTVSVINTQLNGTIGLPIPTPGNPYGVAIQGGMSAAPITGAAGMAGVPIKFKVTAPYGSSVASVRWDFFGDDEVIQTTSTLETEFTFQESGIFQPKAVLYSADGGILSRQVIPLRIQSPTEGISTATTLVGLLSSLNDGVRHSLVVKLDAAADALSRSQPIPACGVMQAFIDEVGALVRSERLTPDAATPVSGEGTAIRTSLGCR